MNVWDVVKYVTHHKKIFQILRRMFVTVKPHPGSRVRFNLTTFDSSLIAASLRVYLDLESDRINNTIWLPREPKMTCFLRFDDCKISYFEINFDIKRQVVTNKAKAGPASSPGWQIFSLHWDSALLNDSMKPSENTHKVKQTQIVISSSSWLCVLLGVMCHEISRDMCDASQVWSWHPPSRQNL